LRDLDKTICFYFAKSILSIFNKKIVLFNSL